MTNFHNQIWTWIRFYIGIFGHFGSHIRSRMSSILLSHCSSVARWAASSHLSGVSRITGRLSVKQKMVAINGVLIRVKNLRKCMFYTDGIELTDCLLNTYPGMKMCHYRNLKV